MTHGDLAALSATEIVALVKAGQVSPVEVVEASLNRIERCNPTLNAVVTLNERAIEDARALESSIRSGSGSSALCGVPVGIKDLTAVAGL
ncbi:MAG: amidase family protein, partial [Gemmatimonadetes bacterium]|nr:amidase family protein [Gemmatimonadota bacterium]